MSRALDRGQQPIAPSALGTGTANNTTFLRGDNTWQTISTTPTTAQVLAATAGASVGAVGTYALLGSNNGTSYAPGATLAGSNLIYVGFGKRQFDWGSNNASQLEDTGVSGGSPAGTWRCMGRQNFRPGSYAVVAVHGATLWLRIS